MPIVFSCLFNLVVLDSVVSVGTGDSELEVKSIYGWRDDIRADLLVFLRFYGSVYLLVP